MENFYIPPQMKARLNFVLWKLETDGDRKPRKVPYSAHYHGRASTADSKTWATYDIDTQ